MKRPPSHRPIIDLHSEMVQTTIELTAAAIFVAFLLHWMQG